MDCGAGVGPVETVGEEEAAEVEETECGCAGSARVPLQLPVDLRLRLLRHGKGAERQGLAGRRSAVDGEEGRKGRRRQWKGEREREGGRVGSALMRPQLLR